MLTRALMGSFIELPTASRQTNNGRAMSAAIDETSDERLIQSTLAGDDEAFAEYVIRRSETGMVWVNEPLQSLASCPWSVFKDSGIGVELGASGVREFTFEKVVQAQFTGNDGPRGWYFPYRA